MSATNKDTGEKANNTSTFVSALVVGVVVFAVFFIVFLFLHNRARPTFQPRNTIAPPNKRAPDLPTHVIGWFTAIWREPEITVLHINGPDAYFFIRFLRFMLKIFVPFWFITWAILMPVSATGGVGNLGLNMFTFGNIAGATQNHHIAHLLVGVIFFNYILWLIYREYRHFYVIRQEWLASPEHAKSAAARTVMLNNVPQKFLSESAIADLAARAIKGPVEQVWLVRQVDHMNELFEERAEECLRLEAAEGDIQALEYKLRKKGKTPPADSAEDGSIISKFIPAKDRPTHYVGLPLISKSVDTLEFSPQFIAERTKQLDEERAKLNDAPLCNSVFIRFVTMTDAHTFCQLVGSEADSRLISASNDVVPEGVIWNNLSMSPWMRKIRKLISWGITIALIIFWGPIVAFVGLISNINTLANTVSFLSWINSIPPTVQGIIQGILPPVALAVLFIVLPIFLRACIQLQGEPLQSEIERQLWARFWVFQVVHGFLIITVASGLPSALQNIQARVNQLPTLLANNLPSASIFFLTFVLTTTLSSAGSMNARLVPWVFSKLTFLRGNTPRKVYGFEFKMASLQLSTTWPPIALLGCITIVYAVIQPIIVGCSVVGFLLFYVAYKYNMLWVMDQPVGLESGGIIYNKALTSIFTSLYLAEVCLAGLFFLQKNNADGTGGLAPLGIAGGVIFAVMIVVTAVFQIWIQRKYNLRRLKYVDPSYVAGSHRLFAANASKPVESGTETAPVAETDKAQQDAAVIEEHRKGIERPGEVYGKTSGMHLTAFDNPATWKQQPVVWITDDSSGAGLGPAEVKRLKEAGILSSCEHTRCDADSGKILVDRSPPDEAWHGVEEE